MGTRHGSPDSCSASSRRRRLAAARRAARLPGQRSDRVRRDGDDEHRRPRQRPRPSCWSRSGSPIAYPGANGSAHAITIPRVLGGLNPGLGRDDRAGLPTAADVAERIWGTLQASDGPLGRGLPHVVHRRRPCRPSTGLVPLVPTPQQVLVVCGGAASVAARGGHPWVGRDRSITRPVACRHPTPSLATRPACSRPRVVRRRRASERNAPSHWTVAEGPRHPWPTWGADHPDSPDAAVGARDAGLSQRTSTSRKKSTSP